MVGLNFEVESILQTLARNSLVVEPTAAVVILGVASDKVGSDSVLWRFGRLSLVVLLVVIIRV